MRARCLIVDDEAPARAELRYLLGGFDQVQVVGEATNAEEALTLLRSLAYDIVLLDIRMPGGSGIEVAEALRSGPRPPKVIFTTAYPDYAPDAFDLDAADYLVKPFDAERLGRALARALAPVSADTEGESTPPHGVPAAPASAGSLAAPGSIAPAGSSAVPGSAAAPGPSHEPAERLSRIPVQQGDRTVLVDASSIIFATAARGYSYLQLAVERVLVSYSLNELERRLGGHFYRTHRSYLVNLDHVRELRPDFKGALVLVMDDHRRSRVEVSRRHVRDLRRLLGL